MFRAQGKNKRLLIFYITLILLMNKFNTILLNINKSKLYLACNNSLNFLIKIKVITLRVFHNFKTPPNFNLLLNIFLNL